MPDPALRNETIFQGQFRVTTRSDETLTTLLGSCVAACLRDPVSKVGGMNHFLLPGEDPGATSNVRYGAHSMEELVNALLRNGAQRSRIEAWLFGGANVMSGLRPIGDANASFARKFVRLEGFRLMGEDLGGMQGRKIRFHPAAGTVCVDLIKHVEPDRPRRAPPKPAPAPSVELF